MKRSRQQLLHDVTRHVRKPEIATHVPVSQSRVIHPEAVEKRSLKVVNVDGILHYVQANFVGCTVDVTALQATAGHPHAERIWMMIAAGIVRLAGSTHLDHGCPTELAAPYQER